MSQWGSNLSYVPPPPVNPSNNEQIPPLQPHLTGLTEFEGDRTFGPQDNTPVGPGPNILDDPTILVQTLLSKFRVFQHSVETRLQNPEQNIQGSLFTNNHFDQLQTDLQTILTQTWLVRQPTGTQSPAPQPPVPQPLAPPAQTSTQQIKLAKPEKFDGKKDKSIAFKVSLMQYLRTTYCHNPRF
ncbi:Transposon Tf2-12 polyprotein [Ceratobasidium sp. AG-Ba]|nr:Transposon Tf2-12 polyprotein [Ceratobasidium sp. AG-Ba]